MPKRSRAKQKRQSRAHELWATEQTDEGRDKRAGEYVVLLWPNMEKTKPMNHTEAMKIWRNHTDRAMVFLAEDFTMKKRSPSE
jgi:hypothetical protein